MDGQRLPVCPLDTKDRLQFSRRAKLLLPHVASHVVAALVLGIEFKWVAVHPLPEEYGSSIPEAWEPGTFGRVFVDDHADDEHTWQDWVIFGLAGPIAQARSSGRRLYCARSDRQSAGYWLHRSGLEDDELRQAKDDLAVAVSTLVCRHWLAIDAVARELIARRFLTAGACARIFHAAPSGALAGLP